MGGCALGPEEDIHTVNTQAIQETRLQQARPSLSPSGGWVSCVGVFGQTAQEERGTTHTV